MPDELERCYDAHADVLYAFLLNVTRDPTETRDLLQEVFMKIARDPAWLRRAKDERGFLIRVAHHLAVDSFRRRAAREKRQDAFSKAHIDPFVTSADPDEAEFQARLSDALAALPPDQRAVVHLKLWERLTFDQIAECLEIPLNTAASRYRYGLDKLRSRLRPIYDEIRNG